MSSAAALLRSACHALRRPPFPRALIQPRAQNSSTRRLYSADCTVGKPETNKATVQDDGVSRKLDEVSRAFDTLHAGVREYVEQVERERRRKVLVRRTIFAGGVLAAVYVKRRFFNRETKEEDKEMSTGNH